MLKQSNAMLDRLEALQRRVTLTPGEKIEVELLLRDKWRPKQVSCHSPEGSIGGAIGVPNVQRGEDVLNEADRRNKEALERMERLTPVEYQGNG